MKRIYQVICEKQYLNRISKHSITYFKWKEQIVFSFLLVFVNIAFAQNNLWVLGNQLVDFSGTTIILSALPQPGANPDLHYTGQVPEKNQAVQFDNNGSLLFFIIDGNIYDGEGYVIALNEDEPSELDENEFPAYRNDIAITNVPGYCDKFYLFSTCHKATFSTSEEVVCTILDFAVQNPNFLGNPERMGTLMTEEISEDIYNNEFEYFFGGDFALQGPHSIVIVEGGNGAGQKTTVNSLEIVEIEPTKKILLTGSSVDGILVFLMEPQSIDAIINCYAGNGGSGAEDLYSSIEAVQLSATTYRLACHTSICNTATSIGTTAITAIFDESGTISNLTEHTVYATDYAQITSMEFSPSGNFLWLTMDEAPYLFAIDIANSTVLNPLVGDLSSYAYSELEKQIDENGANVIYVATSTGLKKIINPDLPANASIIDVTWDVDVPINSYPANSDGTPLIYTIQVQNENAQLLQTFLAAAECCHDFTEFHFGEVPTIATANDGTWSDGSNPFDNQNSPIRITDDLTFTTGTVTTINNMIFEFDEDADVIIQKGARVNLNGTTWTSLDCEKIMWPGVDLLGTTNAANSIDQLPISGGDQGYLNLSNSVIENAMVGIDVGGNIPSNAGGIVRASQSTFRNNYNDVVFKKYRYEIGGDPVQNKSYFNLCSFVTDEHLNNPSLSPNNHVLLKSVDKISFKNCSFMNKTDINTYNWFNRGTGIYSSRASFTLDGSNDPWTGSPIDSDQTTFYKLKYGIRSAGFNDPDAFYTCKEQEFQYCLYGIVNYNTDNVLIYLNNFTLPDAAGFNSNETVERGIYLTNSTGYVVEQNTFDGFDDFQVNDEFPCALGIWIDNSGDAANEIRNNDFNEMKLGTYVTRQNRDFVTGVNGTIDVGGLDDQTGLQLFCNTYTFGQTDVFRDSDTYMRWVQGGNQGNGGNSNQMAGNRFSVNDCGGATSDWVNDPYNEEHLYYVCHDQPNTTPDCGGATSTHPNGNESILMTNSVATNEPYDESDCANTYGGTGGGQTPSGLGGIISQLNTVRSELQAAKNTYNAVVDDNQKQSTLDILTSAFPHESQYYRDLLMQRYPLSDAVLRQLIAQASRLSSWHLTEIFLANSPLKREVIAEIERANILSPFFMSFLYNADSGESLRMLMELNIAGLATHRDRLIQQIAQAGFTYESNPELETDQLIYLNEYLNQINQSDAVVMIRSRASLLASNGNYASAITLVENEPALLQYKKILELEQAVAGDWSLLNAAQISELWSIYNMPSDFSSSMALGILQEIGEAEFEPEPRVPIQYRSLQIGNDKYNNELPLLGVWPNPASNSAWLHYPVEADEHATIEVYDPQGRLLNSFHPNTKGLVELSLKNYETGIYIVQLRAFDKVVESIKLTVVNQD